VVAVAAAAVAAVTAVAAVAVADVVGVVLLLELPSAAGCGARVSCVESQKKCESVQSSARELQLLKIKQARGKWCRRRHSERCES